MDKDSQLSRMIKMMKKAHRNGVPNYRFAQAGILGYTARMSDLRKEGYHVWCVRQKLPNGRMSNVYNYFIEDEDSKSGMDYED